MNLKVFNTTLVLILVLNSLKNNAQINSKMEPTYLRNENLKTIKKDWPGNPQINGRFINPNIKFT